jgi:hypothetical protein
VKPLPELDIERICELVRGSFLTPEEAAKRLLVLRDALPSAEEFTKELAKRKKKGAA